MNDGQPPNTTNSTSFGWAGGASKGTEVSFALASIQIGAKVYIPGLGRFFQPDPVEGGTPNAYVGDPINDSDYSGQFGWGSIGNIIRAIVNIITASVRAAIHLAAAVVHAVATTPPVVAAVMGDFINPPASLLVAPSLNGFKFEGRASIASSLGPVGNSTPVKIMGAAKNSVLQVDALPGYAAYYFARKGRNALVDNVPMAKYTPVNAALLAIEYKGLEYDEAIDWMKGEDIWDEGQPGCTLPLHSLR